MDVNIQSQAHVKAQPVNAKKRPAPPSDEEDEDEMVDKLLPAATAMKRRRLEEQRNQVPSEQSFETSQLSKPQKARKSKKEINIKDVVRERREAEEEAACRDEGNLRDVMQGMNVEEMKNLAVIEELDVPARVPRPQRREPNGQANDRWDERWNGRKNFKKFRRRGECGQVRRGQSVIVPLEEVRNKNYGIGDNYWLEASETKKKRREKERATQSQSQSQNQSLTTVRSQGSCTATKTEGHSTADIPHELTIDGELPEVIDVNAPRVTRGQERTQQTDQSSSRPSTAAGKRAADSQARGPVAKKPRFAVQDSDSDSEDELKFRYRKKGR